MKFKKVLLFVFLLINLSLIAQENSDMIFSIDGGIIKNCLITQIENNNLSYFQENQIYIVEARAYVRKGIFISLETEDMLFRTQLNHLPDSISEIPYKNTDYRSIYKTYHRATVMRNIGIGLTAGGLISGAYGFYLIYSEETSPNSKGLSSQELSGLGLVFLGAVYAGTGVPFFTIGQIQRHRTRKKMQNCFEHKSLLSGGINQDGIGLTLKF